MNPVTSDPRYFNSVVLDSGNSPTSELVSTRRSRRPLVCRWQRAAEGRLACAWQQIGPDESADPPWGHSRGIATPDMKGANETGKSNEMRENRA